MHGRYTDLSNRIEADYLGVREHFAKTLQTIESKENELYSQLVTEHGFSHIRLHGEAAAIFDVLGFGSGDNSFENLSIVEGAIESGHQSADQLNVIRGKLHAYLGVKAAIYEAEVALKEAYANHVAKTDDEKSLATDEVRALNNLRENYKKSFERSDVADFARGDYEAFVGSINEARQTRGSRLI